MSSVIQTALESFFKKYKIPTKSKIAVAVSGGADSLSLALNLSDYAMEHHLKLFALTVNHGLRPEAKAESDYVHQLLEPFGILHTELVWKGVKPKTHLEEKAREKRYELMLNWCQEHDISYLFLAHHQGDQTETFWIRLARGSGIDGLSAISEVSTRQSIYLCRPFLKLSKQQLEQDLEKRKITWVQDSMNQDESYERVYWRNRQQKLSELNLTPVVVTRSAERLNRAKQALDFYSNRFMSALVDIEPQGYAAISMKALNSIPMEIQIRVLMNTIRFIAPQKVPLSLSCVEKYVEEYPVSATFGGCILIQKLGMLYIAREVSRMAKPKNIPAKTITKWDRFIVWSSVKCCISHARGQGSDLPIAVQQSWPFIDGVHVSFITGTEKELEKKSNLDYKDKKIAFILFQKGEK